MRKRFLKFKLALNFLYDEIYRIFNDPIHIHIPYFFDSLQKLKYFLSQFTGKCYRGVKFPFITDPNLIWRKRHNCISDLELGIFLMSIFPENFSYLVIYQGLKKVIFVLRHNSGFTLVENKLLTYVKNKDVLESYLEQWGEYKICKNYYNIYKILWQCSS
jgi:hypothetical protein